jgi:PleD family two-component response regulator
MNYQRLDPGKKDILIIDDMADNLRVLSSLLIKEGYNARKALNWQMALTACQTGLPDLILLLIKNITIMVLNLEMINKVFF